MTFITAHSGADGRPDNSIEFVRYALASPADALEVDIRRCGGGVLRLGHDAADNDAPTLAEVFALVAESPDKCINCDLKEPGLEEEVCALGRDYGLTGRMILTGTADPDLYAARSDLRATARLWINSEEVVPGLYDGFRNDPDFPPRAADRLLAVCRRCGLDTVNLHYRLAIPAFAEPLLAAGVGLSVWTVNEEPDLRHFLAWGVKALTTRSLTAAVRIRTELG